MTDNAELIERLRGVMSGWRIGDETEASLDAAVAEIAAAVALGPWQPMTSAPQDGTQILLREHNGSVSIGAWIETDDGDLVRQWRAFAQGWSIVELGHDYDGHHVDLDPVAWAAIPEFSELKP